MVLTNRSDDRCPFCAGWHQETPPGLQRSVEDGTLRIEFRDLGISATPFFVGGRVLNGAQPLAEFVRATEQEAAR